MKPCYGKNPLNFGVDPTKTTEYQPFGLSLLGLSLTCFRWHSLGGSPLLLAAT